MPLVHKAEQAGTIQSWFADDSAAASVLRRLGRWWDILASDGPAYGYFPNTSKSILVVKERCYREAVELFSDTSVVITCNGARYLGAAIGSADFKENFVWTKVQEWADELTGLAGFRSLAAPGSILCICLGLEKSLGFPMPRSVYFSVPVPATGGPDKHEAYTSNDGSATACTVLREVLAMPCRLGGLGLVSPMTLCSQYESSVAITASLSRRIVDRVSDIWNSLIGIQREKAKRKKEVRQTKRSRHGVSAMMALVALRHTSVLAREPGTSSWLTCRPLKKYGYSLSKAEFMDGLCFCYGWMPPKSPTHCSCGRDNGLTMPCHVPWWFYHYPP